MLSSLFESRNKNVKTPQNENLFELTTKKIQQPKIVPKEQPQIEAEQDKRQNDIIQRDRPEATIFVGNVHIQAKHNEVKNYFSKYGKVQKVWFRSIPVQVNKMGRKASHILKNYIEGADSMNAYVRYEHQQSAKQACKQNGTVFKSLTLRVSLCQQKAKDTETTIFVGNLSHDIKQQQLRDHFTLIGKITSVRVIKDRQTNKGIGIGYVQFETKQEMKASIAKLNDSQLLGRKVRVKKAVQKQRLDKKKNKLQQKYGDRYKTKKPEVSKNLKAIQIRKKGKQIKVNRQANKTKHIKKK